MEPCGLLLFLHVPKSGGTSAIAALKHVLAFNHSAPRHNPVLYAAFLASHASVLAPQAFKRYWPLLVQAHPECRRHTSLIKLALRNNIATSLTVIERSDCVRQARFDWRHARHFMDFHDPHELAAFKEHLLPRLPALRARYRAAGCSFRVGTLLREPRAAMLSHFNYFHLPLRFGETRLSLQVQARALRAWLVPGRGNMQTAWLTRLGACFEPARNAGGRLEDVFQCNLNASACASFGGAAAEERSFVHASLGQFDVVGTTEHAAQAVWALAAGVGIGWSTPPAAASDAKAADGAAETRHEQPSGLPRCNQARRGNLLSVGSLTSTAPDLYHELGERTRCDQVLYDQAARAMATTLRVSPDESMGGSREYLRVICPPQHSVPRG